MVMLSTKPPLAERISALRFRINFVICPAMSGSASHSARSLANPSTSRPRDMTRTSPPCAVVPDTTHAMDGRMTSAPIAASNPLDNDDTGHVASPPCVRSHPAATRRQPPQAGSAPLAAHRCCHDSPGWSVNQSNNSRTPAARIR